MEPAITRRLFAHVQAVAFHFQAWKGSLDSLAAFITYSYGPTAPPPERIAHWLRLDSTQRELESHWNVGVWQAGTEKSFRLVCLAPVTNLGQAQRRLVEFPKNKSTCCAWCWIEEKFPGELKPELDIRREPVPGRYLHRACARPWGLLRTLAESEVKHERI